MRGLILFPVILFSLLLGYWLGILKTQKDVILTSNASGLMFITGIHQNLEKGDYEAASRLTTSAADAFILTIKNNEKHLFWHSYVGLFPWVAMPEAKKASTQFLNRAFDHFSKDQTRLSPEALAYLQEAHDQNKTTK